MTDPIGISGRRRLDVAAPSPPGNRGAGAAARGQPKPAVAGEQGAGRRRSWMHDDRLPAWLLSMMLHTLVVILLALLAVQQPAGRSLTLQGRAERSTAAAEALVTAPATPTAPDLTDSLAKEQPVDVPLPHAAPVSPPAVTALAPQTTTDAAAVDVAALMSPLSSREVAVRLPGGGLGGRSPEGRQRLGQRYGATAASEQAVELALRWLADHQANHGGWSFDLSGAPCNGRCDNPRKNEQQLATPSTAATGLALLAFLGAGHTHQSGPYSETVRRGLYYLRGEMRPTAHGDDLQGGSMYGHAMATLAMAEAAAMTDDADLREAVRSLSFFIVAARNEQNGWGYTPGRPGDITLTGWQVMALLGAKRLRIDLPSDLMASVKDYVDSLSPDHGIHFGYKDPSPRPSTTAIGLTIQMYLGRSPEITYQRQGLDELAQLGPTRTNVYHDYYASLALHHARHPGWEQWNTTLRHHLVTSQAQQGHERGSWHFSDQYGDVGGRLYTTAMCTMMLEIYYRYLPLYGDTEPFQL